MWMMIVLRVVFYSENNGVYIAGITTNDTGICNSSAWTTYKTNDKDNDQKGMYYKSPMTNTLNFRQIMVKLFRFFSCR